MNEWKSKQNEMKKKEGEAFKKNLAKKEDSDSIDESNEYPSKQVKKDNSYDSDSFVDAS